MADRSLTVIDVAAPERLSEIHAAGFPQAWSAADFVNLMSSGASGLALSDSTGLFGFLLWRVAADEAEILTVAVDPDRRRQGAGRILLKGALELLSSAGVDRVILEVAEDNPTAIRLYASEGFETVGRRKGYYRRDGQAVDAQVLQLKLNTEGH